MLNWTERSDWVNVKTDVTPPAIGDGVADDTAAIQAALMTPSNGVTIYFPPGTYRVTNALVLTGGNSHYGIFLVGHGDTTRIEWHGNPGGNLFHISGNPYARYEGLYLDGRGVAGCGFFMRNTNKFETTIRLKHMAFDGFVSNGLHAVTGDSFAMAETSYENCLFKSCAEGVRLGGFNDYDHTFSGCDFINCGIGVYANSGNLYARDCYFSGSSNSDLYLRPEHGCSVRRCKSYGSARFIYFQNTVSPLFVQDCYVDSWTATNGAIQHVSNPTVLLTHNRFVNPPSTNAPVRCSGRILSCNNSAPSSPTLATGSLIYSIPSGSNAPRVGGVGGALITTFMTTNVTVPPVVFDAKTGFGAVGNNVADDTAAIQNTINAARAAGGGAIAYLPLGTYKITSALSMGGSNYVVGGCGYFTRLRWSGVSGGTMLTVTDPDHLRLENIMIGHHDIGVLNNSNDVVQVSTSNVPSVMTYDGVYIYGKYQKRADHKGLLLDGLGTNCVVILNMVEGNIRLQNSADALVIGNITYEGVITVADTNSARSGFLGFQTRLSTVNSNTVLVKNNNSIVFSDFYSEQGMAGILASGATGDPPGRIVLSSPKHGFTTSNPCLLSASNYLGQFIVAGIQMYVDSPVYTIEQTGDQHLDVLFFGGLFYDSALSFTASNGTLYAAGNRKAGTGAPAPADNYTNQTLADFSLALDDLQKLGHLDLALNHPHIPVSAGPVITVAHGPHGSVYPDGSITLPYAGGTNFVVTADAFHHIASFITNGVPDPQASGRAAYTSVWSAVWYPGTLSVTFSANLTTNTGTPEWWLAQHGWTNEFDAAATNDADADGSQTWEEYIADTDPTNGASLFARTTITNLAQTTFDLFIAATSTGRVYGAERTLDLGAAPQLWTDAAPFRPGTGDGITITVTNNVTNAAFRTKVRLP